jgi:hypothetical protein
MLRPFAIAAVVLAAGLAQLGLAQADDPNRLLIVNGNTGKVIYDDGRNDLFCVIRRVAIGYNEHTGRPIYRRTMRCR